MGGNIANIPETAAFQLRLAQIFEDNDLEVVIEYIDAPTLDSLAQSGKLIGNDYVITLCNVDDFKGAEGVTHLFGKDNMASLSSYTGDHPEAPCFIAYKGMVKTYMPCQPPNHPVYKIRDELAFFDILAYNSAHEIYHSMIYRALKFKAFKKINYLTDYPEFGRVVEDKGDVENEMMRYFDNKALFTQTKDEGGFGHSPLNKADMDKRNKEYSLNTSGIHAKYLYIEEIFKYRLDGEPDSGDTMYEENIIDAFFINSKVKLDTFGFEKFLPKKIIAGINTPGKNQLIQGCAEKRLFKFRKDNFHQDIVIPFLSHFKSDNK